MKKIKLPLEMANGVLVRTLDELKENWDLEKVLNYYLNGKLLTWLNDRYYTELAEEVSALNGINDNAELQKKLCGIFGIEAESDLVDLEAVAERNRRLEILRQYTADDAVLKNIDKVAFNQEELADLLDEDELVIYLCDNKFSVPLSVTGKKYIGLGDVEIQVNSKDFVDFAKIGIELVNVHFNKEYEELVNSHVTLYKKGEELEAMKNYLEAFNLYSKAADMGNDKALFKVGYFYRFALGVKEDFSKAMEYFQKAAQKGNARAMHNIGSLYYYGDGVEKNYGEALQWYEKAGSLNFALSYNKLGEMYRDGEGTVRDYLEAKQRFEKAAELGNADAMGHIGNLYYNGQGVSQNYEEALKWFRKGAEKGEAWVIANVGHMYHYGLGVKQDYVEALKWYQKAADLGNIFAMNRLAYIYRNGVYSDGMSLVNRNPELAKSWYEKAAKLGNIEALNEIGDMYSIPDGFPWNHEEAAKWYRKTAEENNINGIAKLAELYNCNFIGDYETNDDMCLKLYEKLIDLGELDKVYEICTNASTSPGNRNTRILLKKVADLGHANAAYEVAKNYLCDLAYKGGWISADRNEAVKYFKKAAELGHPDGERMYNCYK